MNQGLAPTTYFIQKISICTALLIIAGTAWWFLIASEAAMTTTSDNGFIMSVMALVMTPSDPGHYLFAASLMWVVMMAAMMLPAVLPLVILYRKMDRGRFPNLDSMMFSSGYLTAWSAFAIGAAGAQWWLHAQGVLHGPLLATGTTLTGIIFIGAGLYQFTPLKEACINRCQSPLGFFMANWHGGRLGAFRMGCTHGLYCTGCCWALMLLMFAGGAMSVPTMAALSTFILAERLLPADFWVSTIAGITLVGWGGVVLLGA